LWYINKKKSYKFGYQSFLKDSLRQIINWKLGFNVCNYKIEYSRKIIVCVKCSFIIYKTLNNIISNLFAF